MCLKRDTVILWMNCLQSTERFTSLKRPKTPGTFFFGLRFLLRVSAVERVLPFPLLLHNTADVDLFVFVRHFAMLAA